jgi:tetratricopeptide (TPR) repeat protein
MNFESMTEPEILSELHTFGELERANALLALANRQVGEGRLVDAEHFSAAAREVFKELSEDFEAARASFIEGYCLLQRQEYVPASARFEESLRGFSVYADDQMTADVYYNLGFCNFGLQNFKNAIDFYEKSVVLYKDSGQPASAARSKIDIGELRGGQGNQRLALGPFGEALRLYQEAEDLAGVAKAHDRLAAVYVDLGDTVTAIDHLREALGLIDFIGFKKGLAYAQKRLGEALVNEDQLDEAEALLISARDQYKRQKEFVLAAEAEQNLAIVYEKTGREDQANYSFLRVKSVYDSSNRKARALWLRKLMLERRVDRDLSVAIAEHESNLEESKNLGNTWLISQFEVVLANLYLGRSKRGDPARAKALLKQLDETCVSDEALLKASFFLAKAKLFIRAKNYSLAAYWLRLVVETGKDSRFQSIWDEARMHLHKIESGGDDRQTS